MTIIIGDSFYNYDHIRLVRCQEGKIKIYFEDYVQIVYELRSGINETFIIAELKNFIANEVVVIDLTNVVKNKSLEEL